MHYIPILHNVILAFKPKRAFGARIRFGTRFQQLVPANGFRPDEVLL